MKKRKIIAITGYRNYELGIFQAKDPKLAILYKFIKHSLRQLIDNGAQWFIIGGNLGVELWSAQMAFELQNEGYDIRIGVLLPFQNFGENWQGYNQQTFEEVIQQADYLNFVSQKTYSDPSQLRNHTQFIVSHADVMWAIYDKEFPGKSHYLLKEWERTGKELILNSMDDLQSFANDIFEER